ncbi:WhiB family transcriptional regulator [Streptomyces canarius]|nr:WhiB family transcriptional regulator [Streptomyces canarius]
MWTWQADAACRGTDSSVLLSPTGERGSARRRRKRPARAMPCPVSSACAPFAKASCRACGIWGDRTRRSGGRGLRTSIAADASSGPPGETSTVVCPSDS